ncbi:MAG: hypothetical protein CMF39_00845 [Legionellaceae bacterium]|nr:hypothetical protein [Legionellaceae bacterium]
MLNGQPASGMKSPDSVRSSVSLGSLDSAADIHIFDIDGTLTCFPGGGPTDYWHTITKHFLQPTHEARFDAAQQQWKLVMEAAKKPGAAHAGLPTDYFDPTHLTTHPHPRIQYSHDMMQHGLDCMSEDVTEALVRRYAAEVTEAHTKTGVVYKEAITYLASLVASGHACVLSTGGYETGAHGFLDGLVTAGWLTQKAREKIIVSGAVVDWDSRKLKHANVEENKIVGLIEKLACTREEITARLQAVYVDSPTGGDKGLMRLVENSKFATAHIFRTSKNARMAWDHPFTHWWDLVFMASLPSSSHRPISAPGSRALSAPLSRRSALLKRRHSSPRGSSPCEGYIPGPAIFQTVEALNEEGRPRSNTSPEPTHSPSVSPLPSL